jgi:hypothetical protein
MLFSWPALYNGQPFFSPDTSAYIRGFDAGVVWLTGKKSAWTTWASALAPNQGALDASSLEDSQSFQSPSFIIAGRSVSYGALLYLGELLGGLWASVLVQSALAVAAVSLTLKHFKVFSLPTLFVTAGTLGLVSSLPFFASFLLPDVFDGLLILAAANLLALGGRLTRCERVFWLSISATAVVFHPSHLATLILLLVGSIIAWLLNRKISLFGIMSLALVAAIGFASEIGFEFSVAKVLDVRVSRPPVVTARIIADGPGAAYLREKCPQAAFLVCKFIDRLNPNPDLFLWDTSGAYASAPIPERRKLGEEQYQFAAAVLAYDPVGQVIGTLSDGVQQLKMIGLSDFNRTAEEAFAKLPQRYAERMTLSRLWQQNFPIQSFSNLTILVAIFSFTFVAVTLVKDWNTLAMAQKIFCFIILSGLISNALICGGLSGPHERYQARLEWLIPLAALLLYFQTRMAGAPRLLGWRRNAEGVSDRAS